jgi:hypothetical protein
MKFAASLFLSLVAVATAADKGWSFADTPGARDVLFDGKPVLRHMNAYDPAKREETYKPYTHVFDFAGQKPITKGPGGRFTHHRGCFIGWNKTQFDGKSYDFWHCPKNIFRKHLQYLDESKAGADSAVLVSTTDWPTPEGKVVIHETQKITARKPADGTLVLDFDFTLEAPSGPVSLGGDVQHAGFHFRADNDVVDKQTAYIKPEGVVDKKGDVWENCNWVVCQFTTSGHRYAVAHFNDPKNATPLQYSTRAYARFGAFSKTEVKPGAPLKLRYRIIVTDADKGNVPPAAEWQKQWDAFAAGK